MNRLPILYHSKLGRCGGNPNPIYMFLYFFVLFILVVEYPVEIQLSIEVRDCFPSLSRKIQAAQSFPIFMIIIIKIIIIID